MLLFEKDTTIGLRTVESSWMTGVYISFRHDDLHICFFSACFFTSIVDDLSYHDGCLCGDTAKHGVFLGGCEKTERHKIFCASSHTLFRCLSGDITLHGFLLLAIYLLFFTNLIRGRRPMAGWDGRAHRCFFNLSQRVSAASALWEGESFTWYTTCGRFWVSSHSLDGDNG